MFNVPSIHSLPDIKFGKLDGALMSRMAANLPLFHPLFSAPAKSAHSLGPKLAANQKQTSLALLFLKYFESYHHRSINTLLAYHLF